MSMIAHMLLVAAPAPAPAPIPMLSAEQAMTALRDATSIGRDPCRARDDDEILVCGRRANPYALPLHDPTAEGEASRYGGNRARQIAAAQGAWSACRTRGEPCAGGGLDVLKIGGFVAEAIEALVDGE